MKDGSKEKLIFIFSLLIFNAFALILASLIELFFKDYLNPLLFSIIFFPVFTIIVIIIQSEGIWSRITALSDNQDLSRWLAFTHRHSWVAILIAFVILSSYVALYLPERQVLIRGRVINTSDRPINELTLCLSTAEGEAPARMMVDEDGEYSIKVDQSDSFEIKVLESGDNCSGIDTLGTSIGPC
ncbi:MAG: carboxypeptidase-like regulatory domain-containing protein [Anaerolineales bacterium]